jgi:hypothetical protein
MRPFQGDVYSFRKIKMFRGVKSGEYNGSYYLFEGDVLLKELYGKAHCHDDKSSCLAKGTVFLSNELP